MRCLKFPFLWNFSPPSPTVLNSHVNVPGLNLTPYTSALKQNLLWLLVPTNRSNLVNIPSKRIFFFSMFLSVFPANIWKHYKGKSYLQMFKHLYSSFKICPQFWLAKRTRIIHHNQLLTTKFGWILCLTRKWRQKCSLLQVKAPLPRRPGSRLSCFCCQKKNGGHFTRFKSKTYSLN